MFSHTAVALYALVLAGAAAAQSFTVATPASVVQCQPAQLSWSGGQAPYFPSIIPGSQPGAAALKEFPSQPGTSLVWTVDLAAGTSITIQIRDSTGGVQYSSAISIQTSADSSCVNAGVSATASGGSGAATSTSAAAGAPSSTAAGAVSTTAAPAGTASSAISSASTRAAASATSASASASASATGTNSNSASMLTKGAFGVAGLAGLIGAALF
ncbi:putative transmembrane protein [Rhizoctonia solani 123E]|uniref:Putative transmembrane protein n=1 Tax=Rhizoctonia solani 123E TaxID=1423351 RepID=A0A074RJ13_9AGAM|nr:putative transmembrane protein [Rhizoctonia solani 123E]